MKIRGLYTANPLFFSFFFPAVTDGLLTLLGQDATYWSNYKLVNEASPAYFILILNPSLFIIGGLAWFILLYKVFRRLREPWNLILAVAFVAGHSWGSSSWIIKIMQTSGLYLSSNRLSILTGWFILVLYFFIIGIFAALTIREYFHNEKFSK